MRSIPDMASKEEGKRSKARSTYVENRTDRSSTKHNSNSPSIQTNIPLATETSLPSSTADGDIEASIAEVNDAEFSLNDEFAEESFGEDLMDENDEDYRPDDIDKKPRNTGKDLNTNTLRNGDLVPQPSISTKQVVSSYLRWAGKQFENESNKRFFMKRITYCDTYGLQHDWNSEEESYKVSFESLRTSTGVFMPKVFHNNQAAGKQPDFILDLNEVQSGQYNFDINALLLTTKGTTSGEVDQWLTFFKREELWAFLACCKHDLPRILIFEK